jgi:hypothetical protein
MRALINPQFHDRLTKLCGLFSSEHIGERAEAARQADALLRRHGLRWPDIIAMPPAAWQQMAKHCREHLHCLTDRERDFIINIGKLRRPPTDRQLEWLADIFARIGGDA